jgi:hypothetical protein
LEKLLPQILSFFALFAPLRLKRLFQNPIPRRAGLKSKIAHGPLQSKITAVQDNLRSGILTQNRRFLWAVSLIQIEVALPSLMYGRPAPRGTVRPYIRVYSRSFAVSILVLDKSDLKSKI